MGDHPAPWGTQPGAGGAVTEPLRETSSQAADDGDGPIGAARGASCCSSPCRRSPLPLHSRVESVSERRPDASCARAEPRCDGLTMLGEMRKSCSRRRSTAVQMCRVRGARAAAVPAQPARCTRRIWRHARRVMGRQTTHMVCMLLRLAAFALVPAVHSARARCRGRRTRVSMGFDGPQRVAGSAPS